MPKNTPDKAKALELVADAFDKAEEMQMTLGDLNGSIHLGKQEAMLAMLGGAPPQALAAMSITIAVMQLVGAMTFYAEAMADETPENPVDVVIRESQELYRDNRLN